jgi:hypothetical protein
LTFPGVHPSFRTDGTLMRAPPKQTAGRKVGSGSAVSYGLGVAGLGMKRHSSERVLRTGKRNLVGYSFRTERGVVSKGDHLSWRDDTESCSE